MKSGSSAYNKRCRFLFPDYHEDKILKKQFIANKKSDPENTEVVDTQCQIYPFIQDHLNLMTNEQRVFKKGFRRTGRPSIPRPFDYVDPLLEKMDATKESNNLLIYLNDQDQSEQMEISESSGGRSAMVSAPYVSQNLIDMCLGNQTQD